MTGFYQLWARSMTAMANSYATVTLRMLQVPGALASGDPWGRQESLRMLSEKMLAAQQGYWSVLRAMPAMLGHDWTSPQVALRNVTALNARMVAPGYRKVRANRRRLARARRR